MERVNSPANSVTEILSVKNPVFSEELDQILADSETYENRDDFADLFLRPSWIRDPLNLSIFPNNRQLSTRNLSSPNYDILFDL